MKKVMAVLSITLSLISEVYADQIISPSGITSFNISIASGSATEVCEKIVFLNSVSGTLQTNLKTSDLIFYDGKHIGYAAPGEGKPVEAITVSDALTPTATPGLYKLCMTPTNFNWQKGDTYELKFLIDGANAGDNGAITIRLLN